MNTTVAIHQPNYLPWLGYFHKLANCDIFVYLDSVQYPRGQSFAARNRIKTPNGVSFLTIPVSIPKGKEGKVKYSEVNLAHQKWKKKHLKTVENSYKRAPYFEDIFTLYESQIKQKNQFLEITIGLIEAFANYLQIDTERVRLSEILSNQRQKTELIIDICQKLGAGTYLSGRGGGKDYNDERLLNKNGINLRYDDFVHPVYPQLWGAFESHLSIIDLLFNCGPDSQKILLNNYRK